MSHTKDSQCRDIEIFQKVSKAYELRFTKDDCALPITGWTIYFTVKSKLGDADVDAVLSKDITSHFDATNGKTLITLSSTDTNIPVGSYHYDIKYKDDAGESDIILYGRLLIKKPVTQRG